jgi:hypothetical protein
MRKQKNYYDDNINNINNNLETTATITIIILYGELFPTKNHTNIELGQSLEFTSLGSSIPSWLLCGAVKERSSPREVEPQKTD